ncbi:MAG: hypothetical protein ACREPB_11490 [Arenimonas sp.]
MARTTSHAASILADIKLAKAEMSSRYFSRTDGDFSEPFALRRRIAELQRTAGNLIHAIGVGRKLVMGKPTSALSIRLYVSQKLPKTLLRTQALLPSSIDGMPTDVIEAVPAHFAAPLNACTIQRLKRQRPIRPGISLGNVDVAGGTLAARCRSRQPGETGQRLMLSNNHVLADFGLAPLGSAICQPSMQDGGTDADTVGTLLRFVPIAEGVNSVNRVDAAIATVASSVALSSDICSIGTLMGITEATLNMTVQKHARTTGYSQGVIDDLDCDVLIPLSRNDPTRVARFVHQLRIRPRIGASRFAQGGDSGALIITKPTNQAVGLLFACPDNGSYAYANPMQAVLDALDIELDFG